MRIAMFLILLLSMFFAGCREDPAKVDLPGESPYTPEEQQVIANCYTLQEAVEAFAAENVGVYPMDSWVHRTPLGNTLVNLLPGGLMLENPFTQLRTEPIDGFATLPGETGYHVILDSVIVGYEISGQGADSLLVYIVVVP